MSSTLRRVRRALVLLFSYCTSTDSGSAVATTPPAIETSAAPSPSSTSTTSPSPSASSTAGPSSRTKTYTGSTAFTRWGDVQVTTVTNSKITDVQVPVYPNNNGRDQEINAYALPVLTQETLTAQNANIDTVSGATVTSDGYLQSRQAALDAAHLS
jgi:uncharacterized protein with FMN-binding domain